MTLALLVFLLRPQEDSRLSVWLLAGLLPVLVAVTAAMHGQDAAARALRGFDERVQNRTIGWQGAAGPPSSTVVALSGLDAACVVHASAQGGRYRLSHATLYLPPGVQLLGNWPTPQQVNALMVSGRLHCRRLAGEAQGA